MLKNIILDFGGILLDLDFKRCDDRFKELYDLSFEKRNYPASFETCFLAYEQGFTDEATFIKGLQNLSDNPITEMDLIDCWNSMLVQIPPHRLEFLLELRASYRVFLLSNTNSTHIQWVHDYLNRVYGVTDFERRFFDKVYYSHQLKMRKPNHDIYEFVLSDAGLKGTESLFVDDTLENITAAKEVGIHAALHGASDDITDKLAGYIEAVR